MKRGVRFSSNPIPRFLQASGARYGVVRCSGGAKSLVSTPFSTVLPVLVQPSAVASEDAGLTTCKQLPVHQTVVHPPNAQQGLLLVELRLWLQNSGLAALWPLLPRSTTVVRNPISSQMRNRLIRTAAGALCRREHGEIC